MKRAYKILAAAGISFMVFAAGNVGVEESASSAAEPGWAPPVKARLDELVAARAGSGDAVVFDFDNTLICRDIGEATFAWLVENKKITAAALPAGVSPPLPSAKGGAPLTPSSAPDLVHYYEAFLGASDEDDPAPHGDGYAWVVQAMAGLSPLDVVEATDRAFSTGLAESGAAESSRVGSSLSGGGYRRPFFYPRMVELTAELRKNGYDVWVISASNAWTVRRMVLAHLNPRLRDLGAPGIPPERVIGVSLLMIDRRTGALVKDRVLVAKNSSYANMNDSELGRYELTGRISYPLSAYHGKSALIDQYIGRTPYLVAGDSPNDHAMLLKAKNRLWIARLEKPGYQERTAELIARSGPDEWLIQPTLYKESPGFAPSAASAMSRPGVELAKIARSLEFLGRRLTGREK